MNIQHLYEKDITRRINPAVVVSEMESYFVDQEIREYVFTDGITKNIYKFLKAFTEKKEGKTGVWVSGYYGSGKSHFIKYLFYCLDHKYRESAFKNFLMAAKEMDPLDEPNESQVAMLKKSLDKLTIDEIIFNIDKYSDQDDLKDRITRVLLNRLNVFRGYNDANIALALYLEKPLDKKGDFAAFKEAIQSFFSEKWEGNQNRFVKRYLDKVITIAQQFDANIDKDALKSAILDTNPSYTIDFLITELQEFLADKGDEYRLIFMIDEVSQYIGSNTSLLLNLQTIVEEIGSMIGHKVWIVCTAQQDLSNLIDNTDNKTEDFGKILGRFETMISLQSQDAAFITKKRVLEKTADGARVLNDYYKANKGAIENQFVFDHDLYTNFTSKEDFTLTYPFVPYQFRLISDVFESFSNVGYVGEGVKNTERAILGITHFTANLCKEQKTGYFVPFDLFFNEQLQKNLTHLARSIVDRAYQVQEVKADAFNRRVVDTLFMISNLGESHRVNFPAKVENLALLLMESADTPKLDMQNRIQKVLDILVSKNIVQVSEGTYRFLKEDEIEVANLIKSTSVNNDETLGYLNKEVIEKVIRISPNISQNGRNFRMAIQVDEKEIGAKGDFNVKFSLFDHTDLVNLAHNTPSNDLVICIHEWLAQDTDLRGKIKDYTRTQKYIRDNSSSATGTRKETLNGFKVTNDSLLKEINLRFEKKFLATAIISNNRVIRADELTGATPIARFEDMVKRHMGEVYRKQGLSGTYAITNADLLAHAKSRQAVAITTLSPAEEEVNSRITLEGAAPVVSDIVRIFERPPFGWKDIATLDILLNLARKGYRRFEWRNEEVDLPAFADKALNSRERDALTIHQEKVHSQADTDAFIDAVNNVIFAETLVPDTRDFKEAVETFRTKLEPKLKEINQLKEAYEAYPFATHLRDFHKQLAELFQYRNPEQINEQVIGQKNVLKQARDTFMQLREFVEHNSTAYIQIYEFAQQNKNNFGQLDDVTIVQANQLTEYLKTDTEPWDKFPQMKRAYRAVSEAIQARKDTLKTEVLGTYETIFLEIEARKQELGIRDAHLTTDATYLLPKIRKEEQITQLEIYQLKANDFRADNFKALEDYKAKEEAKNTGQTYVASIDVSLAAEMPPTTIETPEQLDDYIKKLRDRLMVKLARNKKIFLN
jgi:hypothetical protein